jgi:Ca-activated chloride channel family protein
MTELARARRASDEVDRTILLSDGAANRGITDAGGLRGLAARMRDRGCAVSTIGLDVDFDEKVMAAIATESNGRHTFVANAADLPGVFERELEGLLATVARDAELVVVPAPGVTVPEVFDRAFRGEGDRVIIPLGTFGAQQEKTALLRLMVPADGQGIAPVASLSLRWRDLGTRSDGAVTASLSLDVTPPGSPSELDPFVAARLERSRTARTLTDANTLFEQGKRDEARRRLTTHAAELASAARKAKAAAAQPGAPPAFRDLTLNQDFQAQSRALSAAESGFASAPAATAQASPLPHAAPKPSPQDSREGKAAVRANQSEATELGL